MEINEDLRNWYNDVTKDEAIPEEILQQAVEHSDVALIVFYRKNGEGSEGKATQGGYYLTDDELAMVDPVNQTFDKTIVVFNTGYTVDMQWVKISTLTLLSGQGCQAMKAAMRSQIS